MSTNSAVTMGRVPSREARMSITADRTLLRLSATLLFLGEVISLVAGYFHPDQAPANDHHAAFAGYAASKIWTAVHLGQFAGMAVIITGLLALFRPERKPIDGSSGNPANVSARRAVSGIQKLKIGS